jgi:hypothetical protein
MVHMIKLIKMISVTHFRSGGPKLQLYENSVKLYSMKSKSQMNVNLKSCNVSASHKLAHDSAKLISNYDLPAGRSFDFG